LLCSMGSTARLSIVQFMGEGASTCGYCHSNGATSLSSGMWCHSLTVDQYQELVRDDVFYSQIISNRPSCFISEACLWVCRLTEVGDGLAATCTSQTCSRLAVHSTQFALMFITSSQIRCCLIHLPFACLYDARMCSASHLCLSAGTKTCAEKVGQVSCWGPSDCKRGCRLQGQYVSLFSLHVLTSLT